MSETYYGEEGVMTLHEFVTGHWAGSLCGRGETAQDRRNSALLFVNQVAQDLNRAAGHDIWPSDVSTGAHFGLLAAPDSTDAQAFGYKPDILTARLLTGHVLHWDIVLASEASTATPTCIPEGEVDADRFREPRPDLVIPQQPPDPGQPPVDPMPPSDAARLLANQALLLDNQGTILAMLDRIISLQQSMLDLITEEPNQLRMTGTVRILGITGDVQLMEKE